MGVSAHDHGATTNVATTNVAITKVAATNVATPVHGVSLESFCVTTECHLE
jgi:hypothetical protein